MRILLLVQYYLPNIQSSAKVMHDLAVEMQHRGHRVVVAAPEAELSARMEIAVEDGLTVVRVRTGRFRDVGIYQRAISELRLSTVMWRAAGSWFRAHPCDLITTYSPTVFFGPLVRRLKRLWSCSTYLVLRDIFPQWSVDTGLIRRGSLVHRFFRSYERLLYDTADVIGVQSPRNLDYFRSQPLANGRKLEVLHNWARLEDQAVRQTDLRSRLHLDGKVVFFYGGNIGRAQDMDNLLRLATRLQPDPRIVMLLVGDGSEVPRIQKEIETRRLTNVKLHPPVEQATYLGLLSECDVGLITLDALLRTHNFPGKMLDYMYFGKPILASINPGNDLRQVLEDNQAGLVSNNGDDDLFHAHAVRLANDPELRHTMGGAGRALLEQMFSPQRAADQILSHVSSPS